MLGMDMMLKSLGLDPGQIKEQTENFLGEAVKMNEELARQGRVTDAIARAHGINPRDYDRANPKEIEHGE